MVSQMLRERSVPKSKKQLTMINASESLYNIMRCHGLGNTEHSVQEAGDRSQTGPD